MAADIASRYKTEPRLAHPVNQLSYRGYLPTSTEAEKAKFMAKLIHT